MRFLTEAAVAEAFDIEIEDHGFLVLSGTFRYTSPEGGGCHQGLGYSVDAAFLKRFLRAFGVYRLRQVSGKPCWVTHDGSKIVKITPFTSDSGETFDISLWSLEKEAEAQREQMLRDAVSGTGVE